MIILLPLLLTVIAADDQGTYKMYDKNPSNDLCLLLKFECFRLILKAHERPLLSCKATKRYLSITYCCCFTTTSEDNIHKFDFFAKLQI